MRFNPLQRSCICYGAVAGIFALLYTPRCSEYGDFYGWEFSFAKYGHVHFDYTRLALELGVIALATLILVMFGAKD